MTYGQHCEELEKRKTELEQLRCVVGKLARELGEMPYSARISNHLQIFHTQCRKMVAAERAVEEQLNQMDIWLAFRLGAANLGAVHPPASDPLKPGLHLGQSAKGSHTIHHRNGSNGYHPNSAANHGHHRD